MVADVTETRKRNWNSKLERQKTYKFKSFQDIASRYRGEPLTSVSAKTDASRIWVKSNDLSWCKWDWCSITEN